MDAERIVRDVADRVREIVNDADERSTAAVGEAEQRAAEIVREAEIEAQQIRERVEAEGRERLADIRRMVGNLERKLGVGDTGAEIQPEPVPVPEPEPPLIPEPTPPPPEPAPQPTPPEPEPPVIPEPAPPPDEGTPPLVAGNGAAPDASAKSDDLAAARLVAMNMALEGSPREQIEAHLAEHYALDEAGALVDDVLSLAAK